MEGRLERIEREVEEIRKYVNDMSHSVVRLEESINWIKMGIRIMFGVLGIIIGILVTLL